MKGGDEEKRKGRYKMGRRGEGNGTSGKAYYSMLNYVQVKVER